MASRRARTRPSAPLARPLPQDVPAARARPGERGTTPTGGTRRQIDPIDYRGRGSGSTSRTLVAALLAGPAPTRRHSPSWSRRTPPGRGDQLGRRVACGRGSISRSGGSTTSARPVPPLAVVRSWAASRHRGTWSRILGRAGISVRRRRRRVPGRSPSRIHAWAPYRVPTYLRVARTRAATRARGRGARRRPASRSHPSRRNLRRRRRVRGSRPLPTTIPRGRATPCTRSPGRR